MDLFHYLVKNQLFYFANYSNTEVHKKFKFKLVKYIFIFCHKILEYLSFSLFSCCVYPADDGALSWEEFKTHFADGVLTEEEMKELFDLIDTNNTKYETLNSSLFYIIPKTLVTFLVVEKANYLLNCIIKKKYSFFLGCQKGKFAFYFFFWLWLNK